MAWWLFCRSTVTFALCLATTANTVTSSSWPRAVMSRLYGPALVEGGDDIGW